MDESRAGSEYEASRRRFVDLLVQTTPEQQELVVPSCPDWRVHDLVSHVVGLATDLSQGNGPTGDVQQWVDDMVEARRATSISEQLREWDESGPAFAEVLARRPDRLGGLLVDLVAHEHDLAGAVGLAADRATSGVRECLAIQAPIADRDLETAGLSAVRLTDGSDSWVYGTGEVELEVRASAFELFRATGGRRTLDEIRSLDHDGDLDRYVAGLVHLPLPEHSLGE